jgi:Ca-activated chloride channel family protein
MLADLKLEVNRPHGQAAGRSVTATGGTTIDLGDLPAGRCVWVAGRVPREGGDLMFRVVSGQRQVAECRPVIRDGTVRPALKALFGARRVFGLEYLIHANYSGDELNDQLNRLGYDVQRDLSGDRKVYAENQRAEAETALKKLLVRESLSYGLACSETAFVAVRTEAGRPVEGTVAVANALPAGWSEQFLAQKGAFTGVAMACCMAPSASLLQARFCADLDVDAAESLKAVRPSASRARRAPARKASSPPAPQSPPPPAPAVPSNPVLFAGTPQFQQGEAVLFDTVNGTDAAKVADDVTLTGLRLEFADTTPQADSLDAGLMVLLFVDDLAAPRARVSVADLVRQGGERPLNVRRQAGQRLRVVLVDANGAWASSAPKFQVSLRWS